MKLCIVNRNTGWPVHDPKHAFGETIEVDDGEAAKGIEQGYLLPSSGPVPKSSVIELPHATEVGEKE